MCIRRLLPLIFLLPAAQVVAQNLIPNPSFEQYKVLPGGEGAFGKSVKAWYNPSNYAHFPGATPDYLHQSGTGQSALQADYYGHCTPQDGQAVAGLIAYAAWLKDFREYLAVPLSEPMHKNRRYLLSFYVTNGTAKQYANGGIAGLGIAFCKDSIRQTAASPLALSPQISLNTLLYSNDWAHVLCYFTPAETYNHMVVGNFAPDSLTLYAPFNNHGATGAYYLFDNFALYYIAKDKEEGENTCYITTHAQLQQIQSRPSRLHAEVTAESPTVRVRLADPKQTDGDTVSLFLNNVCIANQVAVTQAPQEYSLTLDPFKDNVLLFFAHNLGKVAPNTAALSVKINGEWQTFHLNASLTENVYLVIKTKPK